MKRDGGATSMSKLCSFGAHPISMSPQPCLELLLVVFAVAQEVVVRGFWCPEDQFSTLVPEIMALVSELQFLCLCWCLRGQG